MKVRHLFALAAAFAIRAHAQRVLIEAEQFANTGGWDVDQQFMDQMGSSYLLAHGLGVPVKDAVTTAKFTSPGKYRVWVRTRDWVAPWKAPTAPATRPWVSSRARSDESELIPWAPNDPKGFPQK